MQSFVILAHRFGRAASMGLAGLLAAGFALNTAVAQVPSIDPQVLAVSAPIASVVDVAPIFVPTLETHHVSFVSPMPGFSVNSRFGFRKLPGEKGRMHEGVDFAAPSGAPIRSAAVGVVLAAGSSPTYGNFVEVDHGEGVSTFYAHMTRRASGLNVGDRIEAGSVIGFVGSTGHSTGPHLHFELRRNARKFDPLKVIGRSFASLAEIPFGRSSGRAVTMASATPDKPVPYLVIRGRVRGS